MLLDALLPQLSESIAGTFLGLATATGTDPTPTARRLLSTEGPDNGVAAVQALAMLHSPTARSSLMREALQHARHAVRRAALEYFAAHAEAADRPLVLLLAKDPSAAVRLAFAEQMAAHRWPDAIGALVALLQDTRDFSLEAPYQPRARQASYNVARAAAVALGRYDVLPELAITALIAKVTDTQCDDPIVGCSALESLATRDDPRIMTTVESRLTGR